MKAAWPTGKPEYDGKQIALQHLGPLRGIWKHIAAKRQKNIGLRQQMVTPRTPIRIKTPGGKTEATAKSVTQKTHGDETPKDMERTSRQSATPKSQARCTSSRKKNRAQDLLEQVPRTGGATGMPISSVGVTSRPVDILYATPTPDVISTEELLCIVAN